MRDITSLTEIKWPYSSIHTCMDSTSQKYQNKIQINIQSPTKKKTINDEYLGQVEQKIKQYLRLAQFDTNTPKQNIIIDYKSKQQNDLTLSHPQQQSQSDSPNSLQTTDSKIYVLMQQSAGLQNSQQQQYDFSIDDIIDISINPLEITSKELYKIIKQIQQKSAQNQQQLANIQSLLKWYQKVDLLYETQRGIVLYNIISDKIKDKCQNESLLNQFTEIKNTYQAVWDYWKERSNGQKLTMGKPKLIKHNENSEEVEIQKDISNLQQQLKYANKIILLELRKKQLQKAVKFLTRNDSELAFIAHIYKQYFCDDSTNKIIIPITIEQDKSQAQNTKQKNQNDGEQAQLSLPATDQEYYQSLMGNQQAQSQKQANNVKIYNQGVLLFILNNIITKNKLKSIVFSHETLTLLYAEMQQVLLDKKIDQKFTYKYFNDHAIWNLNNQTLIQATQIYELHDQYHIQNNEGNVIQIISKNKLKSAQPAHSQSPVFPHQ